MLNRLPAVLLYTTLNKPSPSLAAMYLTSAVAVAPSARGSLPLAKVARLTLPKTTVSKEREIVLRMLEMSFIKWFFGDELIQLLDGDFMNKATVHVDLERLYDIGIVRGM